MDRIQKKLITSAIVIILCTGILPFAIGIKAKSKFLKLFSDISYTQPHPNIRFTLDEYNLGYFNSNAAITLHIKNIPIHLKHQISHGPIFFKNNGSIDFGLLYTFTSLNTAASEITPLLAKIFTNIPPFTHESITKLNGKTDLRFFINEFDYKNDDRRITFSGIDGSYFVDLKTGIVGGSAKADLFSYSNRTNVVTLKDISLDIDHKTNIKGFWYGVDHFSVKNIILKTSEDNISFNNITFETIAENLDKKINLLLKHSIESIETSGENVLPVKSLSSDTAFINLEKNALDSFYTDLANLNYQYRNMSPEELNKISTNTILAPYKEFIAQVIFKGFTFKQALKINTGNGLLQENLECKFFGLDEKKSFEELKNWENMLPSISGKLNATAPIDFFHKTIFEGLLQSFQQQEFIAVDKDFAKINATLQNGELIVNGVIKKIYFEGEEKKQILAELIKNGNTFLALEESDKAIKYLTQAMELAKTVKDGISIWESLIGLNAAYQELGNYQESLKLLEEALITARSLDDAKMIGKTLQELGIVNRALNDNRKAILYLDQALTVSRTENQTSTTIFILEQLNIAHQVLALDLHTTFYLEEALKFEKDKGYEKGTLAFLMTLASVNKKFKNTKKSLAYLDDALKIASKNNRLALKVTILQKIALSHKEVGENEKALLLLKDALKIAETLNAEELVASTLAYLGNIYRDLDNNLMAILYFEDALKLKEKLDIRKEAPGLLLDIAFTYLNIGDKKKATVYFEEAMELELTAKMKAKVSKILKKLNTVF